MRKHHNKLYFGKYDHKTIFKMPYANVLYPTTDEHLYSILKGEQDDTKFHGFNGNVVKLSDDSKRVASFILANRKKLNFRIQQESVLFYSDKKTAKLLVEEFWDDWTGSESVHPKFSNLGKNTVGCKRLPHGKYRFQVHLKKNVHQLVSSSERESLWQFLKRNKKQCLVSNKYVLDYLNGSHPHCYSGYFYVSEEKMLTPIYMIAQKGVDKVIKFEKE